MGFSPLSCLCFCRNRSNYPRIAVVDGHFRRRVAPDRVRWPHRAALWMKVMKTAEVEATPRSFQISFRSPWPYFRVTNSSYMPMKSSGMRCSSSCHAERSHGSRPGHAPRKSSCNAGSASMPENFRPKRSSIDCTSGRMYSCSSGWKNVSRRRAMLCMSGDCARASSSVAHVLRRSSSRKRRTSSSSIARHSGGGRPGKLLCRISPRRRFSRRLAVRL
mmetsp:Transcript_58766/g.158324  ORF Transcript_58766/g.158324 Transcript_58766/m.158324 type:complete len:218 (-) Transcript_58766:95-748(-)